MNTYFRTQGDGPPVILIHGFASSSRDWDGLAIELAKAGFRSYALDLLGHGNSAKPENPVQYTIESVYSHCENWILDLRLPSPPVLIGHSLGGFLSLSFALRNSDQLRGLILINPFYHPGQLSHFLQFLRMHPKWGQKALNLAPLWLIELGTRFAFYDAHRCSTEVRIQGARDCKRADPLIAHIPVSLPDLTPRLGELQLPVEVIWGNKDMTLNPHSFPGLVKAIPNARGHIIQGQGHKPHLSRADETQASILAFLEYIEDARIAI